MQFDDPIVPPTPPNEDNANMEETSGETFLQQISQQVREELKKVIIGQEKMIDLLLVGLFTGGHVLIEGVPGIAKTLTAKLMAQTLNVGFSRIQFTPDLMPSDVLGTTIYNLNAAEFSFNQGPIFSNIVLIDEINRSPAKTQAALFEVMEEHQITVDGETYHMDFPFMVIATQNPIEQEGTYKLPEAQLDRFLMKINIAYPSLEEEKAILHRFRNDFQLNVQYSVKTLFNAQEISKCQQEVEQVFIKEELLDYIAMIIYETRHHPDLFLGASPRASLALLKGAKAIAAMDGRNYVVPSDIKYIAEPIINHRIILTPEREMEGYEPKDIIEKIIEQVEVPR